MKLVLGFLMVVSFATFMTCVVWWMAFYETEVFRVLGKHGRTAYWTFGSAQKKQLDEYKEVCIEQGYPLDKYRACQRCLGVAIGAWVAMLLLMVALALTER